MLLLSKIGIQLILGLKFIMSLHIEILLSTMYRENLEFLKPIFEHNCIDDFYITIVNQTTESKQLVSNKSNIKVLNSLERGSPASRNLAIKNATKDICLMADDDIVYKPNLKTTILEAHKNQPKAAMISFEALNEEGKLYTNYSSKKKHTKASLKHIFTWVITFKRKIFAEHSIFFNHYFGVGATFKGETEYVFLRNCFDKGLPMTHVSKSIVVHPNESSGLNMGSDNAVFARAALSYRFYGSLAYIWLYKYIFFLLRHKYISIKDIQTKLETGFKGIKTYKALKSTNEIDKIYECSAH